MNRAALYAEVAVNASAPLRQSFTYRIPASLVLSPGQAVYVPFGRRILQGIVLNVGAAPYPEAREIGSVIDPLPLLSYERLQLAQWMSEYYLAPVFDCLSLMLPPGFKRRPLTILDARVTEERLGSLDLTSEEMAVIQRLTREGSGEARSFRTSGPIVERLVRRGLIARTYALARPGASPKRIRQLRLAPEPRIKEEVQRLRREGSARAIRRAGVIEALLREGPTPLSRAREFGLTPSYLKFLQDVSLVFIEEVPLVRDPLAGRTYPVKPSPRLSDEQLKAGAAITDALLCASPDKPGERFVLHGVTGSGKTEVYLAALDRAVSLGKRGIVLVPEISLTPQTVRRFSERFPAQVAVMHSALSLGEHFDMWNEVRAGHYRVVIGPRSALFAPQPDLGLVILDEEHEWTYKHQEGSTRYHARRVAEELCRLTGATLVLGSATPDVETYFRARTGSYSLLELRQRLHPGGGGEAMIAPMPKVDVVDLRTELKEGNRSIFSRALKVAVEEALRSKEQAVLFLNRRGTASFVQCRDCGHVPECRSCAVSLTYHEPESALICHYCRRQRNLPDFCPRCRRGRMRPMGAGTERVEEETRRLFPAARVLRWDRDVTEGKDAHERILSRFLSHDADILIGTQMIAKGLDMPLVTLVGIMSADMGLHFPDFKSAERTFQLLEQVAGRAGRGPKGGRVILQTYSPHHPAIEAAAAHDYASLYAQEIQSRRRLGYPPFGRLAVMMFAHTGAAYTREQAAIMVRRLTDERDRRGIPNLHILGPVPAFIPRLRGRWRWTITLRGDDPAALLRDLSLPRGWSIDIDPVSLL